MRNVQDETISLAGLPDTSFYPPIKSRRTKYRYADVRKADAIEA